MLTGMVYPKYCSDGCNVAQDKGLRLVYPFSVCVTRYQSLSLLGVMEKDLSWLRPDTLPAPHDPAINCGSVHRFLSPVCARLLSEMALMARRQNGERMVCDPY